MKADGHRPGIGDSAARRVRRWGNTSRPKALDLGRLVPLWPAELGAERKEDRLRLLSRLRRALKDERRRGLAGHWAYDLARHAQLVEAYRAVLKQYLDDFGPISEDAGPAREERPEGAVD
jgi:hypothetical protein